MAQTSSGPQNLLQIKSLRLHCRRSIAGSDPPSQNNPSYIDRWSTVSGRAFEVVSVSRNPSFEIKIAEGQHVSMVITKDDLEIHSVDSRSRQAFWRIPEDIEPPSSVTPLLLEQKFPSIFFHLWSSQSDKSSVLAHNLQSVGTLHFYIVEILYLALNKTECERTTPTFLAIHCMSRSCYFDHTPGFGSRSRFNKLKSFQSWY